MNLPQEPEGEQLTEAAALRRLLLQIVVVLFGAGVGLSSLMRRDLTQAAFGCVFTLTQGWPLPALWKQYRFVSDGGMVLVPTQRLTRLPAWVSVPLCILLTLLVGSICSITVMFLSGIRDWEVQAIIGAVNIGLWLYVVHCWRRVLFQKAEAVQTVDYGEPEEGVWPPPPKQAQNTQTKNAPRQP